MDVEAGLAIAKKILDSKRLNKIQEAVFRASWEGQSYQTIANNFGYDPGYVKDAGSKLWQLLSQALEERVTKNNFKSAIKQQENHLNFNKFPQITGRELNPIKHQDWGDAMDVFNFYNRTAELDQLENWIIEDRCRLVTLIGMAGIGKTALVAKLAEQIQDEFEYLIWRSLRNAPPIQNLMANLLGFFSQEQLTDLPETLDDQVLKLIKYLQRHRCLLVLDNAESVMRGGERAGSYRDGYEGYGQLLRCLAEIPHQSTLIITSLEKPKGLAAKEGKTLPVRSLKLAGLPTAEAQRIFQAKGDFYGSESDWQTLVEYYAGNPLALKIVAPAIQDLFDSNIAKFLAILQQYTLVFDDICNLLDRQFNRLSELEKEVMYWLAIEREPISFEKLKENLISGVSKNQLFKTLVSLQQRSLIEKVAEGFTQELVVMDYTIEKLLKLTCQEIVSDDPVERSLPILTNYALIEDRAKTNIKYSQNRVIVKPLLEMAIAQLKTVSELRDKLNQILMQLRIQSPNNPNYAISNILNLLRHLPID